MSLWTIPELDALIVSARKLGFWDDVAFFTAERARLLGQEVTR
ncbi:hypothetical protein [Leifsonia sp. 71-9]|nr:hypothetical protein [Leifsonia sp. 71-9]